MDYQEFEIYEIAHKLIIEYHKMSMNDTPHYEMYEEGRQL